ncbi:ATP synthase subunit C [Clostridiaceae bacterium 35-E11]
MKLIVTSAVLIVLFTIGTGIFLMCKDYITTKDKMRNILRVNLFTFIPLLAMAIMILVPDIVLAVGESDTQFSGSGLGFIAAALSTGLATLGAGYAVGAVGSSALGAVSEDPKILGKTLIFVGLAEGIAIYGLIISILILGRL